MRLAVHEGQNPRPLCTLIGLLRAPVGGNNLVRLEMIQ
jgi:hypothetical protein